MRTAGPRVKKHRVNLTLVDSTMATLGALRASTDATSDAEIFRRALKTYAQNSGKTVVLRDKPGSAQPQPDVVLGFF
jgi:hypothetical protein